MPLQKGSSKKTVSKNIATEVKAGKPMKLLLLPMRKLGKRKSQNKAKSNNFR